MVNKVFQDFKKTFPPPINAVSQQQRYVFSNRLFLRAMGTKLTLWEMFAIQVAYTMDCLTYATSIKKLTF